MSSLLKKAKLLSGEITVGWQDYDWTLNKR